MVDAVVSFALQKLGDFLIQETVRQQNVRTNIEWLRSELGYMQAFLKDADEKKGSNHLVRQWISDIVNISHDIVATLDDLSLKIEHPVARDPRLGFLDLLQTHCCICTKVANLHRIGVKIESLKERVLDISRKRETYGIRNIGDEEEGAGSSLLNRRSIIKAVRRTASFADEAQSFVGLEDVTKILRNEILKDDSRRSVVSIVGMGGLGKTTMARKLYNSSQVMNSFPNRAWVCVSQEYSILTLLKTIIKSFKNGLDKEEMEMLEKMSVEDLERQLRKTLQNQKYLVVVDDVWHNEAWVSLKRNFLDCENGSRVIITTRNKNIATTTDDKCFVHQLRFLTPEESWDLFSKKLSHDYADRFPVAMLDLGKEMLEKCGGLPLAITVLGGLLSRKTRLEEWDKVKEHLWRHMKNASIEISPLLSLSYDDLPSALKQCFLYIGMFPEDYLISTERLMWLWIAEGFILGEERMEDIAEDYLNELSDRHLIQVEQRSWAIFSSCRIHDLLRNLAVEKAKAVSFFDIYDPCINSAPPSCVRHAIHSCGQKYLTLSFFNPRQRSVLFFNLDHQSLKINYRRFNYLCVLYLEGWRIHSAPGAIGNLIHLRYLGLSHTKIRKFPKSIGNLKSLQILDLRRNSVCILPPAVSKLINLRHICGLFKGDFNFGALTNLRTLKHIDWSQWVKIDTTKLINLQELAIEDFFPHPNHAYSLESVGKLKRLRDLSLSIPFNTSLPPLEPLSLCQGLRKLWLDGSVDKPSSLAGLPQSITELIISLSVIVEGTMTVLQRMPNLRSLELRRCEYLKEIICSAKGFPQLEFLRLIELPDLETLQLENGALPLIRGLGIAECPKLKAIPERLRSVSVLNHVDLPFPW